MMHAWKLLLSLNGPMLFICSNVMYSSDVLLQMHTYAIMLLC